MQMLPSFILCAGTYNNYFKVIMVLCIVPIKLTLQHPRPGQPQGILSVFMPGERTNLTNSCI